MDDFMDKARDLMDKPGFDYAIEEFKNVFKAIGVLQQVHSKSRLDIRNVESLFSLLEMARTISAFTDKFEVSLDDLIDSLKKVIVVTLEHSIKFPVKDRHWKTPEPYQHFTALLEDLIGNRDTSHKCGILTFNYDVCMDFAAHYSSLRYGYCLTDAQEDVTIPLLKLHGSMNWGTCQKCNEPFDVGIDRFLAKFHVNSLNESPSVNFPIAQHLHEFEHGQCSASSLAPLIVPPTWNKDRYHGSIPNVWGRAAIELAQAQNIFLIGYSLPETDVFFRYLYGIGSVGRETIRRFWVFDPDDSGQVEERFRTLLGPGAEAGFKYHQVKMDKAIPLIRNALLP